MKCIQSTYVIHACIGVKTCTTGSNTMVWLRFETIVIPVVKAASCTSTHYKLITRKGGQQTISISSELAKWQSS